MREWRSGPKNSLWARPIYQKDIPKLIAAMKEDGLICMLDKTFIGYTWYIGDYPLRPKAIKEVWGITDNQYTRIMDWIIVNDPFGA